jgi:hypothetical protein
MLGLRLGRGRHCLVEGDVLAGQALEGGIRFACKSLKVARGPCYRGLGRN